ncbi:lipoamide acyltransferase component of branched-chain alpha-keto acid dehydrogenase complex, mitochondrial [Salvia miltiorrhiza]|uniref:lipoamide acyltransferase component of branched-chain alpha-keto acid dehydrogenase complex, mitochondrial n=1 Tax=Salvia miltiorrhiza TaxID=226208 RepID=UPI0025AC3334|nr:lipoamide acyltransferase component of branched-chain alpha-keto acid dehydrogenase complex, mitochondrial [Salvia miltiorrhiza]
MISRKFYQKNPRSFSQLWRFVSSAASPPSKASSAAARRANSEQGSVSRAQDDIFLKPRTLFSSKNRCQESSWSILIGGRRCRFTTQSMADVPFNGEVDVPLAQTGEGIAECELLQWFVQEGDQIEEFQPLCEVQSDKATIEITSRYKGRVSKVLHVPGNIVKVGETLLKMVVDEDTFFNQPSEISEVIKAQVSDTSKLEDVDSGLSKPKIGGVRSTPAVRNLAKQYGVNIENVRGTGEDGRVLKEDILNYAARGGVMKETAASIYSSSADQNLEGDQIFPSISSTYGWEYEDRTIPLRGFQRAMVKAMTLAAKIPHFHYVDEINCNALVELKASFQKESSDAGVKYTFLPVLIKSLSMALCKYPMLNSCFSEELQEVTLKGSHNIGIAMATPHGLVVPNIKKVQSLSIFEITKELARLQELALANKLSSDDISRGTITLSNIGAIGGKFGSPLINVPEVSIIAIGRIQKVPQFDEDGNLYPASIMTINIGSDHRVLDGATVAKFCNEWKQFIEKPELLMLHTR